MILTMNQRENFMNIIFEKMKQFGMAYDKYKYESGDNMNKKKRKDLENLADKKYKEFHSGLCPNSNDILGVKVPVLRDYAKNLIKQINVEEYLNNALDDSYEEILLQGMILGLWKTDIETFTKYLENAGFVENLTEVLINLYEEEDKPKFPTEYIKSNLKSSSEEENEVIEQKHKRRIKRQRHRNSKAKRKNNKSQK